MKTIESTVYVMLVNKIPFMISLGKYMKFTTIKNVGDQKAATILKSLQSIKSVCTNKNIFITTLYRDNKFEVLRDALKDEGITLNTTGDNEQVPHIERQIKVVKELVRSTQNSLPYKKSPNRMISCMVGNAVFWINAIPVNSGTLCTISLQTLMTGTTIYFKKHCKINFGAYTEAHKTNFHPTPCNPALNLISA